LPLASGIMILFTPTQIYCTSLISSSLARCRYVCTAILCIGCHQKNLNSYLEQHKGMLKFQTYGCYLLGYLTTL
jgi:hypothetical protein